MSIESICNQSLDLIGYKRHITSIADGSRAAQIALTVWAETRDVLLAKQQPRWAKRDNALTLLRSAPEYDYTDTDWTDAYPDLPWRYEYAAPSDCLVPLQLKPRIPWLPNWRPRPISFRAKVNPVLHTYTILTNQPNAILTCIYSVHNPNEWEVEFVELMVQALAHKFQTSLGERPPARQQQQREGEDANAA